MGWNTIRRVWGRRLLVFLAVFLAVAACGNTETLHADAAAASPPAIEAQSSLTIVEGETSTFAVTLDHIPSGGLWLRAMSTDTRVATVSPAVIWIDRENPLANVTVISLEDDEDVINETIEVALSIDGGDNKRVMTRVIDNDVQQVVTDETSLTVAESSWGAFSVRLARRPSAPVTVTVWSNAPETVTASQTTLTFEPDRYSVPSVIYVQGVPDANTADGFAHVYIGGLPNVPDARVDISIIDDDNQALVLSSTNVPIPEGASATFSVSLALDPGEPTVVSMESSDPSTAAITSASALHFDSSNYNIPQPVTLTSTHDPDSTNERVTIRFWGLWGAAAWGLVNASVIDDALIVPLTSSVYEGRPGTFSVSLADTPGPAGLTVTAEVLSGDITVSPSSIFFSSTRIPDGTFTVTGLVDATSNADRTALLRLSAPGQISRDVEITIVDGVPGTFHPSFTHENASAGALGFMEISFGPANNWPGDGRLSISFPPGYDASQSTFESSSKDGSYSITATPTTVMVVRANGTTTVDLVTLRLRGVRNPPVSGWHPITVATLTSTGSAIDSGTGSDRIDPGPMPPASVVLANSAPAATTTATFGFTTRNPWPADGKLSIAFPDGFGVAAATVSGQSGVDGTFSASVAGAVITLTRAGGTTIPGGTPISLSLAAINNPATSQGTTGFQLTTKTAAYDGIDVGVTKGVVIGCPASITKSPQHGSSVPFGGTPWTNPENVTVGSAFAWISPLELSDYLVASDFQFVLPAGASIVGLRFDIGRYSSYNPVLDRAVRVVKATIGQTDRSSSAAWTTGPAAYGDAIDLWGETWSAADIESSTFGIALAARAATPGMSASVQISDVTATVYLSCP